MSKEELSKFINESLNKKDNDSSDFFKSTFANIITKYPNSDLAKFLTLFNNSENCIDVNFMEKSNINGEYDEVSNGESVIVCNFTMNPFYFIQLNNKNDDYGNNVNENGFIIVFNNFGDIIKNCRVKEIEALDTGYGISIKDEFVDWGGLKEEFPTENDKELYKFLGIRFILCLMNDFNDEDKRKEYMENNEPIYYFIPCGKDQSEKDQDYQDFIYIVMSPVNQIQQDYDIEKMYRDILRNKFYIGDDRRKEKDEKERKEEEEKANKRKNSFFGRFFNR